MITDSPHRYRRFGLQHGHDPGLLRGAVANASLVESQGLTSVLTLKHLAWQSGASYAYLRRIIQRLEDPYSEILRHRRSGVAMRTISAPDPPLMAVHRWILRHIVRHLPVHSASCAYMPGNSVIRCATIHVGATWLIKMDVRDFFHSIDERQVFSVFSEIEYSRLVSLELSRICTRAALGPLLEFRRVRPYTIASYRARRLGVLPQGAPTSGPLANVAMNECDKSMSDLAETHDLAYTRYADDITFSTSGAFSRDRASQVIQRARIILRQHNLVPHDRKTRIAPPGSRRIVLGLLVDGDKVRLPQTTRQRIRDHIRGVQKFGVANHSRHRGFASTFGFVNHVNGLIAFAMDIEPDFARRFYSEWHEALSSQKWHYPIPR
jgi:RNA-directed DNA polymerase